MSKKKHQHHKGHHKKRIVQKVSDDISTQVSYFVDEDGKKVRVKKNQGLYYILRRMWRTYHGERKVKKAQSVESMKVLDKSDKNILDKSTLNNGIRKILVLIGFSLREIWNTCQGALSTWWKFALMRVREASVVCAEAVQCAWRVVTTHIRESLQFVWRDGVMTFFNARRAFWRKRFSAIMELPSVIVSAIGATLARYRAELHMLWVQYKENREIRVQKNVQEAQEKIVQKNDVSKNTDVTPNQKSKALIENEKKDTEEEQEKNEERNKTEGVITYADVKQKQAQRSVFVRCVHFLWGAVRSFFLSIIDLAILVIIALSVIFVYVWQTIPEASTMLAPDKIAETTIIYDRTGKTVLYEIHGEENRKQIIHDAIPDYMRFATIAAEDDAFYNHFGIDPFSIARAIKENLLRGTLAQGGSTITQQLARNVFFTREKTLERKVREAVMALKLEQTYTKDEILDAYLNIVPYGSNAYGIEAAAEIYFGKHARDLTLDEAAMLASLPKATATFSPYGTHTNRLIARQKMILERMRELGFVSDDIIDNALETETLAHVRPFREPIVSPHFVFYVMEELRKKYDQSFIERGGLKVYTTIDLGMQAIAEEVVAAGVARNVRYGAENAALSAVDPRTGDVLAMVGSKDYYATDIDGQVNVTTRLRQPGSSFKPFAYATAFAKGYQPETVVFDVLTNFGPDGSGKNYVPQNYTGRFHGLVSFRNALAQSLNIPAVKALYLAGIDNTIDTAQRMGITTLTNRSRYGLALVLGGAEVRPLDMTAAFGVFANDGMRVPVHAITKIVNSNGVVMYDAVEELPKTRALDADVARKVNSILSDNTARTPAFGRNNPLVIPGHSVAAKTGTTQNYRDAWTVGYTPELSVSVWAGNNNNRSMYNGAAGTYVAAPIWQAFMKRVLAQRADVPFVDYTRVQSKVPMVGGKTRAQRYVVGENRVVGAKYEAKKKEEIRTIYHSILHYINKDTPLTSTAPNRNDSMYPRWEASLRSIKKK